MPRLVQLQEQYPEQVRCIALNVDFDAEDQPPAELVQRVADTLDQIGVSCDRVMSSQAMESVLKGFDVYGIPAVLVYDQQGELAEKFTGVVEYDQQIQPLVASLLDADSAADRRNGP